MGEAVSIAPVLGSGSGVARYPVHIPATTVVVECPSEGPGLHRLLDGHLRNIPIRSLRVSGRQCAGLPAGSYSVGAGLVSGYSLGCEKYSIESWSTVDV